MKKGIAWLLVLVLLLSGCGSPGETQPNQTTTGEGPAVTQPPEPGYQEVLKKGRVTASADNVYSFPDNRPVFSLQGTFYTSDLLVELFTASEATIYYTLDGSEPDETDKLYTDEHLPAFIASFPAAPAGYWECR